MKGFIVGAMAGLLFSFLSTAVLFLQVRNIKEIS